MSKSYQKEVPKSRVNISLDLDTNGAKEKVELPLHLLMIGNYSNNQQNDFSERNKISINKFNFDRVMSDLNPNISINVKNRLRKSDDEMKVNLNFNSLSDFNPDNLVKEVPELKKLLAMRNILKEFKHHVSDNKSLRKELQKIIEDKSIVQEINQEILNLPRDK